MRRIVLLFLILLSVNSYSQTDTAQTLSQVRVAESENFVSESDSVITQNTSVVKSDQAQINVSSELSSADIAKKQRTEKMDKLKVIALYSASIILNGVGDGLNNSNQKTMGHICNGASIGLLVFSPFILKYDRSKWFWYLASYTSLRIGLFDIAYNLTRKLPVDYVGTTSPTDKMYRKIGLDPALARSNFFMVGISLPIVVL